jgi:hypothetical protein
MAGEARSWLGNLGSRVIKESDSEQDKLNKTLLIFASGLMGFAAMVWLAVYLRQRWSPESKPVHAPHAETGR